MSFEGLDKLTSSIQAVVTTIAIVVGGLWAWRRFKREREEYAHVELTADIGFVERRSDWWIVELTSLIENKGKVQHRIDRFEFDLHAILPNDPVETREQLGGQVHFPHLVVGGSWLPKTVLLLLSRTCREGQVLVYRSGPNQCDVGNSSFMV
jgi:hypothetical protein